MLSSPEEGRDELRSRIAMSCRFATCRYAVSKSSATSTQSVSSPSRSECHPAAVAVMRRGCEPRVLAQCSSLLRIGHEMQ